MQTTSGLFVRDLKSMVSEIANRKKLEIDLKPFSDVDQFIPSVSERKISIDGQEYTLSKPAFRQFLTKIDVPIGIITKLDQFKEHNPEKVEKITGEIVNLALDRTIKFQTGKTGERDALGLIKYPDSTHIEGIVGRRYTILPHQDLLDQVMQHPEFESMMVGTQNNYLSNKSFQMTFLSNTEKKDHKVGEIFQFGFAIRNSDTGWGSASTQLFVNILRCSNGAFTEESIRSEFVYHSNQEILNLMGNNINKYLSGSTFNMLNGLLGKAIEKKPILDSIEALPTFLGQVGIPQKYHTDIVKVFEEKNDALPLNGWGIGNAVNFFATHELDRIKELNKKHEEESEHYEFADNLLKKSFGIMMTGIVIPQIQQTIFA